MKIVKERKTWVQVKKVLMNKAGFFATDSNPEPTTEGIDHETKELRVVCGKPEDGNMWTEIQLETTSHYTKSGRVRTESQYVYLDGVDQAEALIEFLQTEVTRIKELGE